jgi:hypothetical protein
VIETRHEPNEKSGYRGEFVREGFLLWEKTSGGSFIGLWVFGEFVKTETGTNIDVTIKFDWKVKAIFVVINAALAAQLAIRVIRGIEDWPLFLGFLVVLWGFFLFQSWFEVRGFRRTIKPLFEESEEGKEEGRESRNPDNL